MEIIVKYSNEDKCFIATCKNYKYISAFGNTKEEAIEELKIVLEMCPAVD